MRIIATGNVQNQTQGGEQKAQARWALVGLSLSMLLASLGTSIANVSLPTLAAAFGASFQSVQWVVLAYLLAVTTSIVSAGRLGDMGGRRRLLIGGLVLFTAASAVCGVSRALWVLIAARAAQGVGAAMMMALTMALAGQAAPKEQTGRAMGWLGTMSAIGTALGPSLAGVLISKLGWRAIFFLNVPLGVIALILTLGFLPRERREPATDRRRFDTTGTLLLAATLGMYALAMTLGHGRFGLINVLLLLGAAMGSGLFVLVQRRATFPLIQGKMFRNAALSGRLTSSMLVSTVVMATLVVGPFYLSRALKLDSLMVGLIMSVGPLVAALTGVPAGRLTDRLGAQRVATAGLTAMVTGSLLLCLMPVMAGTLGYVTSIATMTAGYALFQTANNTATLNNLPADQRGVVSGLLNLSRNLGLITGASLMSAVFAHASGAVDIITASAETVRLGMQVTFLLAAFLIMVALGISVRCHATVALLRSRVSGASMIALFVSGQMVQGQSARQAAAHPSGRGPSGSGLAAGTVRPSPAGPYPSHAAGWGPEAGNGLFVSRWAEDWTAMRAAGEAPPLKALPLGGKCFLTLSAETRVRYDLYDNAPPSGRDDLQQGLLRAVIGADLQLSPHLRVYGEAGTGQVAERRRETTANFQNDASLQQLFVDAHGYMGSTLVGAMVGRQEFADGPRQLISLSDGPNLHRTWNGVRLYAHDAIFRVGAFDLRATRLERGTFDEQIDDDERLQGVNASLTVFPERKIYVDPFWFHSENPALRVAAHTSRDERDTYGVRLWGGQGRLRFDWTAARQTGAFGNRDIEAWGVFAVQSFALSDQGWKPRLTAHIDAASGGGANATGTLKGFNPLYTTSTYLGEGRFLSLNNLLLIAPGFSVSPTAKMTLSMEYGMARRLVENDAVYAGGLRAYPGTRNVPGREIGGLFRLAGTWSATDNLSIYFGVDHLAAGEVLKEAGRSSGSYGYAAVTFRY